MFDQATQACVGAVIRESQPGGWIRQYYYKQASGEGPMRRRFTELISTRRSTGSFTSANERHRDLNRDYRTRFKLDHLPAVAASIERVMTIRDGGVRTRLRSWGRRPSTPRQSRPWSSAWSPA